MCGYKTPHGGARKKAKGNPGHNNNSNNSSILRTISYYLLIVIYVCKLVKAIDTEFDHLCVFIGN